MLNVSFKENFNSQQKSFSRVDKKQNSLLLGTTIVTAGVATIGCVGLHAMKKSLQKVFEKRGLNIKDGILTISKTGENFTGTIERHVGKLGFTKETRKYENGVLTEKLYHNLLGKELNGYFYKNGILHTSVNVNSYPSQKNKLYSVSEYEKGNDIAIREGFYNTKGSIFEVIRKELNSSI